MSALNAAELQSLLGSQTSRWHELGLTVATGTPSEPDAADQVTVRHGDAVVGWTEWSTEFSSYQVFHVVIAADRPAVPCPAGWMPPDPLRVQRQEQRRWLPGGAR